MMTDKTLQQIDRWFMHTVFARSRVFKINLDDCRDEFGNTFGHDGSHFFVRALKQGEDHDQVFAFLKEYYNKTNIRSFNQTIGHEIADPAGEAYFCPWEKERIRPLKKFEGSHKIGPTPDDALDKIVIRLLKVVRSIREHGFRQYSRLDGFARVIGIIDKDGNKKYLIRDGNHRIAALSYLNYTSILATYDADFWTPSPPYRLASRLRRGCRGDGSLKAPRIVNVRDAGNWPHVKEGRVTEREAIAYFNAIFGETTTKT